MMAKAAALLLNAGVSAPPPLYAGEALITGTTVFSVPAGYTGVVVEAITRGTDGWGYGGWDGAAAGGAGGCWGKSNLLTLSPGTTEVYIDLTSSNVMYVKCRDAAHDLIAQIGQLNNGSWVIGSGVAYTGGGGTYYTQNYPALLLAGGGGAGNSAGPGSIGSSGAGFGSGTGGAAGAGLRPAGAGGSDGANGYNYGGGGSGHTNTSGTGAPGIAWLTWY